MVNRTLNDHLFGGGPKRILALDGGGIRGILSLQILKRVESILQARAGDKKLRLCDYFDLIGGTSTGAIIAAGLALGYTVDQLDGMYRDLGSSVFDKRWFRKGLMVPKFPAKPLRKALEKQFGDAQMGDPDKVRTGLAIVTKRLDTGSPWVIHNNPRGKYFDQRPGSTATPNREFAVASVVRASTAAPTYFEPETITVAKGLEGAFVDGGVSPHNNPSLQLLMLASLEGHGLQWPLGAANLLLMSIGTGSWELTLESDAVTDMPAMELGVRSLGSLMNDASALNEQVLQWLSRSPTARQIDREVGDLRNDVLGGGAPWLTYLRYEAWLDPDWLVMNLGMELTGKQIESLKEMDNPKNLDLLAQVGHAAATHLVEERQFPQSFDL